MNKKSTSLFCRRFSTLSDSTPKNIIKAHCLGIENKNDLNSENYLIPLELHLALFEHNLYKCGPKAVSLNGKGLYLVNFRLLKDMDKRIAYNYIYFHESFAPSLFRYLVLRNLYKTFTDNENYLVVLDNNIINTEIFLFYCEWKGPEIGINLNWLRKWTNWFAQHTYINN
jgi:hypothetical protein